MEHILSLWTIDNYQILSASLLEADLKILQKNEHWEADSASNAFILILDGSAVFTNHDLHSPLKAYAVTSHSVGPNSLLFSPLGCQSRLSATTSTLKCLLIRFRLLGVPSPADTTDSSAFYPFPQKSVHSPLQELAIGLPKRISLQPTDVPYDHFMRIINEIPALSRVNITSGYTHIIQSLLTECIVLLLRNNSPEFTHSVNKITAVCLRPLSENTIPFEAGTAIWISPIEVYDRISPDFKQSRHLQTIGFEQMHQELPLREQMTFSLDRETTHSGHPTAHLQMWKSVDFFRVWLYPTDSPLDVSYYKNTCVFHFFAKVNRPASWIIAFMDDENSNYVQNTVSLRKVNQWIPVTLFLNPTKNQNPAAQHVQKALAFIDAHISLRIKTEDIAKECFLSASYLSGIFKEHVGVSITNYIISRRIELAKKELSETSKSIESISRELGFYDIQHFSKTFTQKIKISPREYRKLTNPMLLEKK